MILKYNYHVFMLRTVFLAVSLFLVLGCAPKPERSNNGDTAPVTGLDYSHKSNWVYRTETPDKAVDVFYVYPTIYADESPANMDINSAELRAMAKHLLDAQASVYSGDANLFAPYYQQMSIMLNPDKDIYRNPYFLIGYSVTAEDFKKYPWFKPAARADDTGVIISYNTQAPDAQGSPVLLPGAFCINPLNWRTDATLADKSMNLGAVFFNDTNAVIEREVPGYTGARIDEKNGALITTPPDQLDGGSFPEGVYHKYDYAFWYRNLKTNVAERIQAYRARSHMPN